MRKSVAFPYYSPTSAFSGFAPGRLAGAFRGHSLVCPANGSSPLLARPASVTEPADVDVREVKSQAQKLAEIAKLVEYSGQVCLPLQKIARDCRVDRLHSVLWVKLSDRTAGFPSFTSASGHESPAGVVHPLEKCGYFQYGFCYARKSSRVVSLRYLSPGCLMQTGLLKMHWSSIVSLGTSE